jgi:cell division protein FtsN
MKKQQTGGTIIGFIVGVIAGLGAALAVAVYVTKVPVPFLNKSSARTVDMDAAETKKNKDWDPNAPLYGKNPARPPAAAASAPAVAAAPAPEVSAAASAAKPAATKPEAAKAESKPGADPLGDLAVAKAAAAGNLDPFDYFVQVGAFRTQADADAQRAKLAMLGWEARVSEREQNGRPVFRVRIGPFTKRPDAEQLKEKLEGAGVESALVRVQR